MSNIRLAIAGLGNCASALVQGIQYYERNDSNTLAHPVLGGYEVTDIKPVCGFDIDSRKVGKSISSAIQAEPNCAIQFVDEIAEIDAPVYRGPESDGVADHMEKEGVGFKPSSTEATSIVDRLVEHDVDVLIAYLPVGSTRAIEAYARACLDAGVAFVNPIPVFIASDEEWEARFDQAGLPVVGDDIKSQVGATITHRALTQLLIDRGADLIQTSQLNYGGNTDFKNMLSNARLSDKKISKTKAVNSLLDEPLEESKIHIGPSDYVAWMDDTKQADIRLEGEMFGGVPFDLEVTLRVEDSPNSAGSAVDAIRGTKVALDNGMSGSVNSVSSYTMKHPPEPMTDEEAIRSIREFL